MKKILNNKWIIIIGLCLFIIILLLLFLLVFNKKHFKINKSVDIVVGGYNQVITVNSLDKVKVNGGLYPGKYLKIDMEILNKKNIDSITALEKFSILNNKDEIISNCYHDSLLPNNTMNDIFPKVITASKVTKGYLYCPIEKYKSGKLKITVIAGGNINNDNKITYEYKDYYIDLRK